MSNLPPSPGKLVRELKNEMKYVNNLLLDTENWILENKWPYFIPRGRPAYAYWEKPHPTGRQRYEHPEWKILMKDALADTTWDTYCAWCESGMGEEWMTEGNCTLSEEAVRLWVTEEEDAT